MVQPFRALIVDPDRPSGELIRRTAYALRATEIVPAASAAAALNTLSDPERPCDLVFADYGIAAAHDMTLVRWIRTDEESQRPNVPIVVMHDGPLLPSASQSVVSAGTRLFLQKPLTQARVATLIERSAAAYSNFVVSPSYIGPERRAVKRPFRDERRITRPNSILIVEDPMRYEIADETVVVVFDYLRLRVSGADPRSFRDFLTPQHLEPALRHVSAVQRLIYGKVEQRQATLEASLTALDESGNGDHLKRMNRAAWDVAVDCASAGWVLMASIAKSLHHYTSGAYRPSKRLVRFLASHISALKSALRGRIFGDGGRVGHTIVQTIRSAELVFRAAAAEAPGGR